MELKVCAEKPWNASVCAEGMKAHPLLHPTMQIQPYQTPSPYVRRHDRIEFVRIGSSSQLAAHASPHVESREVFPTFLQEESVDCHCFLIVGRVMRVGLDSVEEIMMFVGCLAEKVQWY